jgi:sugar lactone lactonase YvrE
VPARDGQLPVSGPGQALAAYADLSGQSGHPRGDMVVDGRVMPYIGNTGLGFPAGQFAPGILAHVGPDGAVRQAPGGLAFPRGMAGTPDCTTLILAKTYAHRSPAFDTTADGSLAGQRVWADLPGGLPDGIRLDAGGAGITTGPRPESKACGAAARRAARNQPRRVQLESLVL